MFVRLPISEGMVLFNELLYNNNVVNLDKYTISDGIVPVNWLSFSSKSIMFVRLPISEGMVLVNEL